MPILYTSYGYNIAVREETKFLHLRLPKSLHERLAASASVNRRSVTGEIVFRLERDLRESGEHEGSKKDNDEGKQMKRPARCIEHRSGPNGEQDEYNIQPRCPPGYRKRPRRDTRKYAVKSGHDSY